MHDSPKDVYVCVSATVFVCVTDCMGLCMSVTVSVSLNVCVWQCHVNDCVSVTVCM